MSPASCRNSSIKSSEDWLKVYWATHKPLHSNQSSEETQHRYQSRKQLYTFNSPLLFWPWLVNSDIQHVLKLPTRFCKCEHEFMQEQTWLKGSIPFNSIFHFHSFRYLSSVMSLYSNCHDQKVLLLVFCEAVLSTVCFPF